jgi:monofunctional glycosyltransferase
MRFRSRAKGSGRRPRGGGNGESRPRDSNPFAEFDRSAPDPERRRAPPPEDESPEAVVALPKRDPVVRGEPRPGRAGSAPSPDAPSAPHQPGFERRASSRLAPSRRLFRLFAFSVLFVAVMPAIPVSLLRFVPPPVSSVMVERWLDARVDGRAFELRYDWVPRERIARSLRLAVVASEDQRFYQHGGFDWKELRNAVAAWRDGDSLRGASTISQQVAKNLFLWSGRSFLRKAFEAWFTVWIEWIWPKQRILEVYLNIAEMGEGVFGAEAAAQRYFKRPAANLALHEAALIAASLPSPLRSNPGRPSELLRKRQRWILRQI